MTCIKELLCLLSFTMLAASTVGPGTVITCARAGAKFQLKLTWVLILASWISYILQMGAARLSITSKRSLGQCLRLKFRRQQKLFGTGTGAVCWILAFAIGTGGGAYQCNNWSGGMIAVLSVDSSLPQLESPWSHSFRWGTCIVFGFVVFGITYWDKKGDRMGPWLGVSTLVMGLFFALVVITLAIDGQVPWSSALPDWPDESAELILSLVSTTAIGLNLFLGSNLAKNVTLQEARRGIRFSTFMSFIISFLILAIGSAACMTGETVAEAGKVVVKTGEAGVTFKIGNIVEKVEEQLYWPGRFIFSLGFFLAALSSMLAVIVGTVESIKSLLCKVPPLAKKPDNQPENTRSSSPTEAETEPASLAGDPEDLSAATKKYEFGEELPSEINTSIIVLMIAVAIVAIGANANRVDVIKVAQVINGILLSSFSFSLMACLNDPHFMDSDPQKGWENIFLVLCVTISLFLSTNVLLTAFTLDSAARLGASFGISVLVMLISCSLPLPSASSAPSAPSTPLYEPLLASLKKMY